MPATVPKKHDPGTAKGQSLETAATTRPTTGSRPKATRKRPPVATTYRLFTPVYGDQPDILRKTRSV